MKTIRRLILSLDGTWNNRDDSTNVLYSHSLAFDCREKELERRNSSGEVEKYKVTQERFYQEGVGTGSLDRLTGGGFGFGLDQHVREAYNWLVQYFEDGDGTKDCPPDEIYIFGFSRGAYTARSLVGFIGMCGLLRRGAPLTVTQLWENYCILGLALEERNGGIMGKVFGRPIPRFRRITGLVLDPWYVRVSSPVPPGDVPGLRKDVKLNPTEDLLVRWSRRVKITYLGVYDTVGAVGWDALAIPGLRSKLAVQHNMRPSTIVQKCRHALAIDEHRSSFSHTPFVAYLGEVTSARDLEEIGAATSVAGQNPKMSPADRQAMKQNWEDRIQQRWFVGAHSNIGGSYADNRLAQRPLEWILEGARTQGLICETLPAPSPVTPAVGVPRDSYAEFAAPLWTMALRAKRNYRRMLPLPELRANRDEAGEKGAVRPGFSLGSINESVDETVLDYWKGSATAPPNLVECAARLKESYPSRANEIDDLAKKPTAQVWPGDGFRPQLALILWAALAATGLAVTGRLFCVWCEYPPVALMAFFASLFPLVDWGESCLNSFLSRHGLIAWKRSLRDSLYWTRALVVVLFAFGLIGAFSYYWSLGWHSPSFAYALRATWSITPDWVPAWKWGAIALGASAGAVLANGFNGSLKTGATSKLLAVIAAPLIGMAGLSLVVFAAYGIGHIVTAGLGRTEVVASVCPPPAVITAGLLLLLQLAFAYFTRAFVWVGEPMTTANLGSITPLQWNLTPAAVKKCLDRWCRMLGDQSQSEMAGTVRQALWRDAFGFIPVYTVLLLFGLWFGAKQLEWVKFWPPMAYLWFALPITAAVADYFENFCHCKYLSLHQQGRLPTRAMTIFAFSMTVVKTIAFCAGTLAVISAILCASGHIAFSPQEYGWRGLIGLLLTITTISSAVALAVWGLIYRILNWLELKKVVAASR